MIASMCQNLLLIMLTLHTQKDVRTKRCENEKMQEGLWPNFKTISKLTVLKLATEGN
jgi:hypothetical protein